MKVKDCTSTRLGTVSAISAHSFQVVPDGPAVRYQPMTTARPMITPARMLSKLPRNSFEAKAIPARTRPSTTPVATWGAMPAPKNSLTAWLCMPDLPRSTVVAAIQELKTWA
jgi:hypothetical protein